MSVAAPENTVISLPILVIVLITSSLVFTFGYRLAVMRRANFDYKKTKEGLPLMRKAFWTSWRLMMKVAAFVTVAAFILIAWVVRDFTDLDPAPQPSPAATRTR